MMLIMALSVLLVLLVVCVTIAHMFRGSKEGSPLDHYLTQQPLKRASGDNK